MVRTKTVAATTDKTGTFIAENHIKCRIHLLHSISRQLQATLISNQHSAEQKCYLSQNYTCSKNQPSSRVRTEITTKKHKFFLKVRAKIPKIRRQMQMP